jgi:phenylacetate-CoA ligase
MKSIKEAVFNKAPVRLKELGLFFYSYLVSKKKYGNIYQKAVMQLRQNYKLNEVDIITKQKEYLSEFLIFLYKNNPYYNNYFVDLKITLDMLQKNPEICLTQLPLMEKEFFKENLELLESNGLKTVATSNTSGTSGSPMTIPIDSSGFQLGFAYWRRFYDIMGLPERFSNVRFSGRIFVNEQEDKKFWLFDKYEDRHFFSTYHLHEKNLKFYIKKLNEVKPDLIDGYPSAITIVAKYILDNGISVGFKPKAIAVTAETLSEDDRVIIEKAFHAKVYNQYASSEGSPFITECSSGNLHLNLDTGIFEFRSIDGADDNLKELIVTSFRNKKVPLVRYRIKDTVKLRDNDIPCSCGCKFPLIDNIEGRLDDIVYSTERGAIGRLDPIYKGVEGIEASQIIQIGLDRFIIKIKPCLGWNSIQEILLKNNFLDRLGSSVVVEISKVDHIPLGANGKFKSVINKYRNLM